MANPYEPPKQSSNSGLNSLMVPGTYKGGWWAVTAIGVLGGLVVSSAVYSDSIAGVIPIPFVVPAIAWIGAMAALMFLLRDSSITTPARIFLPLLLAIPAYILYVPVCTITAAMTTPLFGAEGYGPRFSGVLTVSVLCFVLILLLFAAVMRRRFKRHVTADEAAGDAPGVGLTASGQQTPEG